MGKKNKTKHNHNQNPQRNQGNNPIQVSEQQKKETSNIASEIESMHSEKVTSEQEIEIISKQPETQGMKQAEESKDLKATWEKVKDLWKLADAIRQIENDVNQKKEILSKKETEITNQIETIKKKEKELFSKENELLEKDENLLLREKNAENDFIEQRKKHLDTFRNEIDSLTGKINSLLLTLDSEGLKIDQRKVDLETSFEDKKEKLQQEYSNKFNELNKKEESYKNTYESRIQKLEEERDNLLSSLEEAKRKQETEFSDKLSVKQSELDSKILEYQNKIKELENENHRSWDKEFREESDRLQAERRDLRIEKENFQEEKEYFDQKVEKKVAKEKERFESDKKELETKLEEARKLRDEKEEKLRLREEADRRFGNQTPEEVLNKNDALKKENESLREKLSSKADETVLARLEALERKEQEWNQRKKELEHEISVMKDKEHSYNIEVVQFESLREENESLISRIKLKEQIMGDLQKDIDNYTKKVEEKKTFPACSKMDANDYLQKERNIPSNINDLSDLIKKSQQRIASLEKKNPLYYADDTLRAFVAGLAMSRLTILQGISGTGKTSLPVSFAKAIGGHYSIIEVQSGWKDRQDLIGYYNTFEGKYYESEFLKALYEASCPAYANQLYFIILDEMNLSHPEHYFADFLSMLEQREDERNLKLVTHGLSNLPKLISGSELKIPSNVWFIGTANHDETTMQFAPKTMDRANVMEMPKNIHSFKERLSDDLFLDKVSLDSFFQKAIQSKSSEVNNPIKYLNETLKKDLEPFEIGWGNRLENQLQKFIPVYLECGGSNANAMDHVIYTKIFRNLKDRFDIKVDKLKKLKDNFEESFHKEFNGVALRSQELLEKEISNRDSNSDL